VTHQRLDVRDVRLQDEDGERGADRVRVRLVDADARSDALDRPPDDPVATFSRPQLLALHRDHEIVGSVVHNPAPGSRIGARTLGNGCRMDDPDAKTLDELDPPAWGPPLYDSFLVRRGHELRTKPLREFTTEDLRIMIGQGIGLPHLVPRALTMLEANPLAEGDMYAGDLLHAMIRVPETYWKANREEWFRLSLVVDDVTEAAKNLAESIRSFRGIFP
jgi:CDI immunity proteins